MNSEELLLEEIYRLKNQITDLKNALDLNREFLNIISAKQSRKDPKTDLLYKIIYRLTHQSNDALIRNVELIHQKNHLKLELHKITKSLEEAEAKLEKEIKRNNDLDAPTLSKVTMQQQFLTMNKQLLASHQEKIHLQEEIQLWKVRYQQLEKNSNNKLQELLQENQKGQETEREFLNVYKQIPLKKSKLSRKYTCNKVIEQDQKRFKLEKENRSLKHYIQELQQRILLFIKAYNLEENILQRRKSSPYFKNKHPLQNAQTIKINLLKYAINQIALQQRENELFMRIKRTFFQSQQGWEVRKERRTVHSYPKHKQYQISQQTTDSTQFKLKTDTYVQSSR